MDTTYLDVSHRQSQQNPPVHVWQANRKTIISLYIHKKHKLSEVSKIMAEGGFEAR
jgi:hypothetical protein